MKLFADIARLFKRLSALFARLLSVGMEPRPPKYRIRYIKDYGFIPECYCKLLHCYLVVEKDFTKGVPDASATMDANRENFHESEAEALATLDKFIQLSNSERSVVWSSD